MANFKAWAQPTIKSAEDNIFFIKNVINIFDYL